MSRSVLVDDQREEERDEAKRVRRERDALRKTNRRWDSAYAEITRKLHVAEDERNALCKALVAFFAQARPPSDEPSIWKNGYLAAVADLRDGLEKAGAEIEGPK